MLCVAETKHSESANQSNQLFKCFEQVIRVIVKLQSLFNNEHTKPIIYIKSNTKKKP